MSLIPERARSAAGADRAGLAADRPDLDHAAAAPARRGNPRGRLVVAGRRLVRRPSSAPCWHAGCGTGSCQLRDDTRGYSPYPPMVRVAVVTLLGAAGGCAMGLVAWLR